jgi:hypothetical protein
MAGYLVINNGGVILNYFNLQYPPQTAEGELLIELPEGSPQDIRDGYYWYNTETSSLEIPATVEGIEVSSYFIASDGVSSSTISNLPDPCWLRINNDLVEVNGGSYNVTSDSDTDIVIRLAGKFVSPSIIYIRARSFEALKGIKWEDVKKYKQSVLYGGCLTPLGRIDTTLESQNSITFYALQAVQDPNFTIDWTMKDNSVVSMNSTEFVNVYQTLLNFKKDCQTRSEYFRAAIDNTTTLGQLEAINIYEGWPS